MLPPNVHTYSWLPQSDLLHHPKTIAFITHGGYNSFQEAVVAGVPLISIPLIGDQSKNALLAEHHGFSILIHKEQLSEELLYYALKEITSNERYAKAVGRLSKMVKHQPVAPSHLLVKWSEFVAEFHTLENLTPAGVKLNFIQYYSIDVIAFLFLVLMLVSLSFVLLLKCALRRFLLLIFGHRKQKVN
ncbi:hypothetical protein OESDEN_07934 [Oesophagostomum dentatum]|uniref:UDP-glucuronosyltransferase n=1 Tax=Oesophagostomum dentatum TaxID=61180 RepID=A0A0B1T4P8_OESDE|nr:hypothetical protein OESDEN_07934 [Oesophagostomum dentatum]